MEEGNVQLNRVFEWNSVTDKVEYVGIASQTLREIAELRAISINEIEEEIERRRLVLEYMADENIRSIDEVGHYINSTTGTLTSVWTAFSRAMIHHGIHQGLI